MNPVLYRVCRRRVLKQWSGSVAARRAGIRVRFSLSEARDGSLTCSFSLTLSGGGRVGWQLSCARFHCHHSPGLQEQAITTLSRSRFLRRGVAWSKL